MSYLPKRFTPLAKEGLTGILYVSFYQTSLFLNFFPGSSEFRAAGAMMFYFFEDEMRFSWGLCSNNLEVIK